MVGAALTTVLPLAGLVLMGAAIGTIAPIAQSSLLRGRIADGANDLEANALAGKAAIAGQILGPAAGYGALSLGPVYASSAVVLFEGFAVRRSRRRRPD